MNQIATAHRDPQSGEFSCLVAGQALLKGKTSTSIKRVYDMVDAINAGGKPYVTTTGNGDSREFQLMLGDFVVDDKLGALKAYRELDKLEAALACTVLVQAHEQPGASEAAAMGSIGLAQVMPEVVDPDQIDLVAASEDLAGERATYAVEGEMEQ